MLRLKSCIFLNHKPPFFNEILRFAFASLLRFGRRCLGVLIGSSYATHFSGNRISFINTSSNKLSDLLHIIDERYVDTVNMADLVERSMPQILKELDPHSTYISAKDVEASMQDLRGSFSGIGVQFTIYDDTVRVVRVIPCGQEIASWPSTAKPM